MFPKTRFHALLSLMAIIFAVMTLLSTPAQGAERGRDRQDRQTERVVQLQPMAGAEVVVPHFKAVFHDDGSVTVSGRGRGQVGAPASGFDFMVDLAQGTYTTRRLDPAEIEEREPLQKAFGENSLPASPGLEPVSPWIKVSPGTWWGRVRVQTKDPAFLVLTETTIELTWTVYSNGTVTWNSYSDGCWGANPSALGTHWYVNYCALAGPWYSSSSRVCNDNSGSYYNYDFLDASQRTDVSQYAWMCGRNDAYFDYNWSHNDSGEASLLIYGSVVTN